MGPRYSQIHESRFIVLSDLVFFVLDKGMRESGACRSCVTWDLVLWE